MNKNYTIEDFLEIKSSYAAIFNYDATKVAYLSNTSGTAQLYLTNPKGDEVGQLTAYPDSLNGIAFSPVRNEIIFTKCENGDEKYQIFLLDIETKSVRQITNTPSAQYRFNGWSRDGRYITYSSNKRNGKDFDVYVMDVVTETEECIFEQGGACGSRGFSPLGNFVVVSKTYSTEKSDVFLVRIKNKLAEQITKGDEKSNIGNIKWLPDESGFFFTTDKDRDFNGLAFYDLSTKSERYILTPNWDIFGVSITHDGNHMLVIINEDGYLKITIYQTNDMKPLPQQDFPKGVVTGYDWSIDGKHLIFRLGNAGKNGEIFIWSKEENKYWSIIKAEQGVPEQMLVEPELIRYKSFDGLMIPAFLYLPKNISHQSKFPVVVDIHGGPAAQSLPLLDSLTQYLVYCGYAVISPNVRGSTGYGKRYTALDDVRKRMDSVKDIAELHKFIKQQENLDAEKVILWGGSYGGYMVLAGLTFFPKLWAGGIDEVGISNLVSFLENTAPYRRAIREAEYGSLEHDREFLASLSPINFAENIEAPLFIIHGANDPRVPLSEAEQMHTKILAKGGQSELLIYLDEGHGLSKLKNRIDAYTKATNFLKSVTGM